PSLPLRLGGGRPQFLARTAEVLVHQLVPEPHMEVGTDTIPFGSRRRGETHRGRRVPETGERHADSLDLEARLDPIPGLPRQFEATLIVPQPLLALPFYHVGIGETLPAYVL